MNVFGTLSPDGSPIFLSCLPNERGNGSPTHRYARNEDELQKFITDHDKEGFALYRAASILNDGAWRKKEEVRAAHWVWAEVDFKDHPDLSQEEIRCRLDGMPIRPTLIVFSGHGYHLWWKLREAVDARPGEAQRRLEEVLRLACAHVGGDPQVAEVARLMRLPGSHNTRHPGEKILVEIVAHNPNLAYELDELADVWLEARPVLPERTSPERGNGHSNAADFDFSTVRGNPDARLAAMRFKGPDDTSIHLTQLLVTGSLTGAGRPVDETVRDVLAATKAAVANDDRCKDWDWDKEKKDIREMCHDLINKVMKTNGEDLGHCLPDNLYQDWNKKIAEGVRPVVFRNRWGYCIRGLPWELSPKDGGAAAVVQEESPPIAQDDGPKAPFILRTFKKFDSARIPPREFLFSRHYQRRTVSGTVAPGGTGKSSLVMVEAIAMATGRNLLDEEVKERVRVWYHNGEDNMLELQRRVAGICQHYEIPMEELEDWFFMTSGNEVPLRVAETWSQVRLQTDHRLVKCITEAIGDNGIDVAILDPLVTLHGVPENNPGQMDQVIRIFTRMADAQNCAIDLSHHTRKLAPGSNGDDVTIDDMRGAGAVKDAMRAVRMLNVMSPKDAESAGLMELERTNYFRIDRAKANYSGPAKTATWRQFVNVDLPNGDGVGVVTPWLFPGQDGAPASPEKAEAERRAEHVFLEVLRRLNLDGRFVGESGNRNAPYVFAKEREAKIAKVGKAALDAAMRRLFERGKIRIEEYTTGHRNTAHRIVET